MKKAERGYEHFRQHCGPRQRILIVLDGLERMQLERPEQEAIHGSLESQVLRQFLLWIAQSPLAVRVLITTRFRLPDLEPEVGGRVTLMDVDNLTRPQARSLLKRRGAEGTQAELDELLDHFGAHALTIDHLGGVIADYLDGRAARYGELGSGPLTRFESGQSGARLSRVLRAYQNYLGAETPQVRDALQRVAIFPRPVGAKELADIFLSPERAEQAASLSGSTELELAGYLNRLDQMRFLRREVLNDRRVFSIHPAVRDVVLEGLTEQLSALAGAAREELEFKLDTVAGRPGTLPTTKQALDYIEELIGFCIQEGRIDEAKDLYKRRLGGWDHLGRKLGEFSRVERIQRVGLHQWDTDLGWSLLLQGRLAEASTFPLAGSDAHLELDAGSTY